MQTPSQIMHSMIFSGGIGPGAYYPWIYVQMAIAIPLLVPLFTKYTPITLLFFFIFLSQILEVICCVTDMPVWFYRLCFFRYFFIVYLGYMLAKNGIVFKKKTIVFAIFGVICLWFFTFMAFNLRPLFYTGIPAWKLCHWPNYIYMYYVLIPILWYSWILIRKNACLSNYVMKMGKYSYEIFLFQMIWFSVVGKLSGDESMGYQMGFMIISILMCILPVVYLKNRIEILKLKKNN